MFRLLKEIYFTVFTVFFRIGGAGWTPDINAWRSVTCIALIEGLILLAIEGWIEIFVGASFLPHIEKWKVVIVFFILGFANYYPLVVCRHGIEFEREFSHLKKTKKVFLLVSCATIILTAIAVFIFSAIVHRRLMHAGNP